MVLLNTHIQPTHFLRAWICWCAWLHYLYTSYAYSHIVLIRMHPYTCMTSTMLRPLASYTHTPVPIADVPTYILVLLPRLSFSVYVYHTYLYTYLCMCTCVLYSTRSVPHHTVPQYWYSATYTYTCVPKYTYSIHISTSITCHCACHHLIISIL